MTKNLKAEDVYSQVKAALRIGVWHHRFYKKKDSNWHLIFRDDLAVTIRQLYTEEEQKRISTATIKEVLDRLSQDPYLQLHFIDEEDEKCIKLKNTVFNVVKGSADSVSGNFSYFMDFDYLEENKRNFAAFDRYVSSVFPEETENKRKLLLQILGYCISDYTKAKVAFFLIGASNSGKSTILELIKKIVPEQLITSIPLYRLNNRFNLAKLSESKINLCTELSEKSFSEIDIFKALTSCETVTAEHKGGKPFEFRIRCKSLNAGNMLPDIQCNAGVPALINRLVILLFPISIPKEKQDLKLVEKLYTERNSIFSAALDELVNLVKNDFCFIEPSDSLKLKKQILDHSRVMDNFISERCIRETGAKIYLRNLYDAFVDFCEENLIENTYSKTKFSQYLAAKPDISQKKMRINHGKPLSGLEGIRLKTEKEYLAQDSERYSPVKTVNQRTDKENEKPRNTGTTEQVRGGDHEKSKN